MPDGEPAGAIVAGRYKLLEPIGEGGMGTVWMAEQREPVKRLVALKLIKPGMDSRAVLARFEAERQALALMDHPSIARILDGGTTRDEPGGVGPGRPYFVMELVKGRPLTEYCDARRLSIKDRLDLFVQICSAVQHAHQKGIIHRDLKPSNVLVTEHDGRPVPKVIDFGLAKALSAVGALTDRTLYTAFGTVVGTPLYMAPEQVGINALDVDTRSDIYALGVILYELLTGTTPLEKRRLEQAAWEEVRRVIREEEPPRPSLRLSSSDALPGLAASRQTEPLKLTRMVRGDLDWIVMKALEKDRTRRYETASALARDIERYLHDEPVEASPPSRRYRLRKFARKHRRLIGTAAGFVLLVAAGAGVSTWQAMRAREAERAALMARDDAAEQLRQAKRSEARANAVLKFFQDKVLSAARPKGQEGGLSRDATVREALDRAEPEIATAFAGEPLVEASIRNTLGVSYWYLGDQEKALQQQERAVALRRQELGPEHPETVGAMNDLAIVLNRMGKFAEEQKILEEVVAVKRRTLGPEDPVTLRSVNNLAIVLAMQGLLEDAVEARGGNPGNPAPCRGSRVDRHAALGRTTWRSCSRHLGRWAEARPLFDESLQTLRRVFGPDHQDTLRVRERPGRAPARPAPAGGGPGALRGGPEGAADRPRPDERRDGPDHDQPRRHRAPPGPPRRGAQAGRGGRRAESTHPRARAPPDTFRAHHPLQHRPRPGPISTWLGRATRRPWPPSDASSPRGPPRFSGAWPIMPGCSLPPRTPATATRDCAIELANELIRNSPKVRDVWTTLGVAHYRAGAGTMRSPRSRSPRPRSPDYSPPPTASSWRWLTGSWEKRRRAREWYAKALQSVETASQPTRRELALFRSEAARLLGISDPKPPSTDRTKSAAASRTPNAINHTRSSPRAP